MVGYGLHAQFQPFDVVNKSEPKRIYRPGNCLDDGEESAACFENIVRRAEFRHVLLVGV